MKFEWTTGPQLLSALKEALPYVERVAATAPTEMNRQERQRKASKLAAAIRETIAKAEKAVDDYCETSTL